MRGVFRFLAALLVVTASVSTAAADPQGPRSDLFPRPAVLEPQVRFWRAVFADYSKHQVLLHDTVDLDKVYKVLDFRPYVDQMNEVDLDQFEKDETRAEMTRIRETLWRLHQTGGSTAGLGPDEKRIVRLFRSDQSPDKFRAAMDQLRSQRGLQERFADGLAVGRTLYPEMERIFREHGLPVELTRMPLIESCFNLNANSKVGAAGIWQFMPSTGRRFLTVSSGVDERRDPIASSRAAARYLREMYDDLRSWPLAISGWNHGPDGLARAARELGTSDIGVIVRQYRGNSFGFASRNFYAEFLAALDVDHRYGAGAGEAPRWREHQQLERATGLQQAAATVPAERPSEPAIVPAAARTVEVADEPVRRRSSVHETRPSKRATKATTVVQHRVRKGQTLSHIAKHYGVSVARLRTTNKVGRTDRVRAGQVLKIPRSA
jgi:membrane-bound lytic murein transglycosylase D